jgi:aryl-alcohol dehydrogenase-like predicted oxidoreductase
MRLRSFGSTGLQVSERGFGAWAIGGRSFGPVEPQDALDALARAEALGCNFVDTAAVYGDAESLLGRFLPARRSQWIVASKYSGQPQGMSSLVDEQLRRLRIDCIDFYQLHWAPTGGEEKLYDELEELREAGKIRYCGVSLRSSADIDRVLKRPQIDGIQVAVSLLDPDPLRSRRALLRQRGIAVVARSALKGGFLTGKYDAAAAFDSPDDQRREWSRERIRTLAAQAREFAFAAEAAGSLHAAAVAYPLSFPEVSTVVLSCKSAQQADANFSAQQPVSLPPDLLDRIERVQRTHHLFEPGRTARILRRLVSAVRGA